MALSENQMVEGAPPGRVPNEAPLIRAVPSSLLGLGVLTILISAWGGIIPYVGPTFGYSADASGSWHWNLAHFVLALAPGAIGVVMGLVFLSLTREAPYGRGRALLWFAGFVCLICGAWFAIGPTAWPVITDASRYFVPAAPLRALANAVGYALGPGVILASCGAFGMGWAVRHQRPRAAVPQPAPVAGAAVSARPATVSPAPGAAPGAPAPRPSGRHGSLWGRKSRGRHTGQPTVVEQPVSQPPA